MTKKKSSEIFACGLTFFPAEKFFFLKGRHLRSLPRAALVLGTPLLKSRKLIRRK